MAQFKVGDKIRIKETCADYDNIGDIRIVKDYYIDSFGDRKGMGDLWIQDSINKGNACSCQSRWELVESNNKINQIKNIMSNIVDTFKNLTLSADEKLLRKQGLKDSYGNYTSDAKEIALQMLCEDKAAELVKVATVKEAEEKE